MPDKHKKHIEQLGQFLRRLREKQKITQHHLGCIIERDQTFVSKYEAGLRCLDIFQLMEVCKALGYPFEKLCAELSKDQKRINAKMLKQQLH